VGVLKEHEAARKIGRSRSWPGSTASARRRFMWPEEHVRRDGVGEAQRLRSLEDENRRLNQQVAGSAWIKEALKANRTKNGWSLPA
jgi:hypothetical protein